jgi:anaerobic selenocysteine-containing dehydrogenase
MCACRCGIRVHLRDGEVRYIDGNPEHPLNQGVICAKGSSGIMKQAERRARQRAVRTGVVGSGIRNARKAPRASARH